MPKEVASLELCKGSADGEVESGERDSRGFHGVFYKTVGENLGLSVFSSSDLFNCKRAQTQSGSKKNKPKCETYWLLN